MWIILGILVLILIKSSLAPRRQPSIAFVIYKSLVILVTWITFLLSLTGASQFLADNNLTLWLAVATVLFSIPTFAIGSPQKNMP